MFHLRFLPSVARPSLAARGLPSGLAAPGGRARQAACGGSGREGPLLPALPPTPSLKLSSWLLDGRSRRRRLSWAQPLAFAKRAPRHCNGIPSSLSATPILSAAALPAPSFLSTILRHVAYHGGCTISAVLRSADMEMGPSAHLCA